MAVKFTASLDGVGHSELSNWLLSTNFSDQYGPALLGHLYFDVNPTNNFFGGRGAVSIRDNRTGIQFSRLAPGEVGTTTTPPAEPDRQLTTNDGTAPIRFTGNIINARANWALKLDQPRDIQLTGKAVGAISGPLWQGDTNAVVTVTQLKIDTTSGTTPDTLKLGLTTGNIFFGVAGVATDRPTTDILISKLGLPHEEVRMGTDAFANMKRIINMADPIGDQDAVTKKYMLDNASGIQVRTAVDLATREALAANTFTVPGGGAPSFIEANVVGGPLVIDDVGVIAGNRVLIKDEASKIRQGIYDVTDAGSAGTKFKLTRSADSDTTPELQPGMYYTVVGGTINLGSSWVQTSAKPFTLDVQDCLFSLFSSSGGYVGGQGIAINGKSVHFIQGTNYPQGAIPYALLNDMAFSNVGILGQPFLSGATGASGFGPLNLSSDDNVTDELETKHGGTGRAGLTIYNVLLGAGLLAVNYAAPTTAGYALMSNGPTAYPTFQAIPVGIKKFVGSIGAGVLSVTLAHGMGTAACEAYVARATSPFDNIICDVFLDSANVTVTFKSVSTSAFTITVLG